MRRTLRLFALPLLLYIVVDFADPSMPGVFCFDSDNLFVDGIVQPTSEEALGAGAPRMDPRAMESLVSQIAFDSVRPAPPPVVRSRSRAHTRLLRGDPSPSSSASDDH